MADLNWLNLKEAAQKLNISYAVMCRLVREQKIQAVKLGRNWAVTEDSLERFLKGK